MTLSVSHNIPGSSRFRAWLYKDDNRASLWITEPRVSLAYAVSDLGQRIMRIAGRISDETISDVGSAMSEEFEAGYRVGLRAGARATLDAVRPGDRASRDESTAAAQ